MKLRVLFMINTVIAVLFGLGMLLIPDTVTSFYDVILEESGAYLARLLGAAFIGIGIISWMAKDATDSRALRAILLGFFISESLGFVVTLIDQLRGVANTLGWTIVAIYLLTALGFGYFYWKGRQEV